MTSILTALQEAIAQRIIDTIKADEPGFASLEVASEIKGTADQAIMDRLVAAQLGITVATPTWAGTEERDGIVVEIDCIITENAELTRGISATGRSGTELSEYLYAYLHQWQPSVQGWAPLEFLSHSLQEIAVAGVLLYLTKFHTSTYITNTSA